MSRGRCVAAAGSVSAVLPETTSAPTTARAASAQAVTVRTISTSPAFRASSTTVSAETVGPSPERAESRFPRGARRSGIRTARPLRGLTPTVGGMTYAGDLTPPEAWDVLQQEPEAVLVDVRSEAEWM